ncbi:di-heme oxidoredictase family protein [Aliikangiella maris]|uniref:Di-heme oxidoredictase family protein n=2 Tax=Aliikangiella maris TaxID=3162458 RepID=A0ABV2BYM3_9GAMM
MKNYSCKQQNIINLLTKKPTKQTNLVQFLMPIFKPRSLQWISRLAPFAGAISLGLIVACGGSGGGSTQPEPPEIKDPPIVIEPPKNELPEVSADVVDPSEVNAGGEVTVARSDEDAFGQSAPKVSSDFNLDANFKAGNMLFRNTHAGQGPILNTATCQGCHVKDGRGHIPMDSSEPMDAMLIKISAVDGQDEPTYGGQIQTFGIASFEGNDPTAGLPRYNGAINTGEALGEAYVYIEFTEINGQYPDGENYVLRQPTYRIKDLSYGDISPGSLLSPRVAPALFGLGLLGAIAETDIRALADPNDANNDGISGRVNQQQTILSDEVKLGRFGSKAFTTSVLHQTVMAYRGDMGITSSIVPDEPCTVLQQACIDKAADEPNGGNEGSDITHVELALVEFYSRTLAVPKRRGYDAASETWQADIWLGRQKFFNIGCTGCHVPRHQTGEAAGSVLGEIQLNQLTPDAAPIEALSSQVIWPYTDLLLHDMGGSCQPLTRELVTGESCSGGEMCEYVLRCDGLADGRPEGLASGSEWRTAPLWGLGLVKTVNPRATYLHDGRARTIEEAILWHGGEAQTSLEQFKLLNKNERAAVIAFLESM